ncbi:MAG: MBL fold metallo-hydrolase [Acidobacteriales bacterium]|nr:MBL fold metallo-hydrolase [Terriglobales bacterium]
MHSLKLGKFSLTIVSDGTYYLDAGVMFGVVPKTLWSMKYTPDEQNRMSCGTNSVLVRGGEKTVLIETGIGNKLGKLDAIYEPKHQLLNNLRSAGVQPEEIDIVINSHLHFDHCGWNTVIGAGGKAQPTFPKAQYYAQHGEWEHAQEQHERDRISYISDNYNPLIESGQMTLLRGNADICDGVRVQVFPGHTRWMQAIYIESEGQTACYISDLIPTSMHLDLGWVMAYDVYPLETIDSRKRYYQHALNTPDAPHRFLTIFTHDHATPWAWLHKNERGRVIAEAA